jgi:hypothetical protein
MCHERSMGVLDRFWSFKKRLGTLDAQELSAMVNGLKRLQNHVQLSKTKEIYLKNYFLILKRLNELVQNERKMLENLSKWNVCSQFSNAILTWFFKFNNLFS